MKTHINWLVVAVAILALSACKRDRFGEAESINKEANVGIRELVAPQDFDFSTDREVEIKVAVVGKTHPQERFIIRLYRDEPNAGSLILTAAASAKTGEFTTRLKVPKTQEYLWIESAGSLGERRYEKVRVSEVIKQVFFVGSEDAIQRKSSSGLDCNSHCTQTYANHTGSITVGKGEVACFTGVINGNIKVNNGGAAKICADGTIGNLTINGSGRVYIIEGASITATSIEVKNKAGEFFNWSDSLTVNSTMAISGFSENHGNLRVNGDFNINSGAEFKNYGYLTVSTNLNVNHTLINYSKIEVAGQMNNNSKAEFYNYCNLSVAGNLNNNSLLYNGRLLKCQQTYTQNSSGSTQLDNVGMLSVNNLMVNGTIEGIGTSQAVVKVANTTTINSSGLFKGMVDLCDDDGVETNNGQMQAPAAISCGGYIPTCPCNTEGFGTPHIDDDDGDGIPNNQDEYPNDPLRAFNSYVPCFNVCYSIVFEDLWPGMGDYDYNDMVIKFSVHKVLNSDNKVVDLKFLTQPIAIGASFENGFGFKLDGIAPSAVESVNGQSLIHNVVELNENGTEANQSDAVIVCFDSPEPLIQRASGGMFNTQPDRPQGTSVVQTVIVTFATPVDDALLEVGKLNPFIFTNKRRGYEIHMTNQEPTDLVNTSLFGTQNDRSNPAEGKYYHTANGLPWAFMLECDFDYPIEKVPVTTAYYYFDDWVLSGGVQYPNWFRNFPQYRDNAYIYAP